MDKTLDECLEELNRVVRAYAANRTCTIIAAAAKEPPEPPAEYTDWERRVYLRGWRDGAGVPHPEPNAFRPEQPDG